MKRIFIAFASALFLSGCGNEVRVVDNAGKPLKGAKVSGISLSMSTQSMSTNDEGYISIPSSLGVQEVKWIRVVCDGYQAQQVPVPKEFPLVITMTKGK